MTARSEQPGQAIHCALTRRGSRGSPFQYHSNIHRADDGSDRDPDHPAVIARDHIALVASSLFFAIVFLVPVISIFVIKRFG